MTDGEVHPAREAVHADVLDEKVTAAVNALLEELYEAAEIVQLPPPGSSGGTQSGAADGG